MNCNPTSRPWSAVRSSTSSGRGERRKARDQRFPGGYQPAGAKDHQIPGAAGTRHPDAGRNPGTGQRLLPGLAWLLVQLLRHLGLAARFSSGYLVQLKPDRSHWTGLPAPPSFTDLHAWCGYFLPGAGWVGLGPDLRPVRQRGPYSLACPNPVSAAPIVGATDKCEVEFDFSNTVERILEPRVLQAYSEERWQRMLALGKRWTAEFDHNDVRLTMGGRPPSSPSMTESAQWNTDALGMTKLSLAKTLLLRLRDRFCPQGLLHYGQGKWYPGENYRAGRSACSGAKDGEPVEKPKPPAGRVDKDYGHDVKTAALFGRQLCDLLATAQVLPARFRGRPVLPDAGTEPAERTSTFWRRTQGSLDRGRLARLIERGFDVPSGVVIP